MSLRKWLIGFILKDELKELEALAENRIGNLLVSYQKDITYIEDVLEKKSNDYQAKVKGEREKLTVALYDLLYDVHRLEEARKESVARMYREAGLPVDPDDQKLRHARLKEEFRSRIEEYDPVRVARNMIDRKSEEVKLGAIASVKEESERQVDKLFNDPEFVKRIVKHLKEMQLKE